jgi:serine acetyltransferase
MCGVKIGRWAMIGAGSVVTRDVPDYGLVWGNPARLHGFVCPCGERLQKHATDDEHVLAHCPRCDHQVEIAKSLWETIQ